MIKLTDTRTAVDFAHFLRELVEVHYSHCEKIVLVMDNLNIHSIASLYKAFDPAIARQVAQRLEIHHTPIHASWLNMAEIETGILSRQCLYQSMPSFQLMARQVNAWTLHRNTVSSTVHWRFSNCDANRYQFSKEEIKAIEPKRKGNKDKRAEARLKVLKLRAKGANAHEVAATGFHAADESGFGRINKPKYCWCEKGIRPSVPCHHIREYRYAYGAVEPLTGEGCFLILPYCNTACVNLF